MTKINTFMFYCTIIRYFMKQASNNYLDRNIVIICSILLDNILLEYTFINNVDDTMQI